MIPNTHSYRGRKCSRHYRFPAPPQDQAGAISSAPSVRYKGVRVFHHAPLLPAGNSTERWWPTSESTMFKPCDPVWLLPAGNSRVSTCIISGSRTVKYYELVTICRDLIIKSERVTTDGIETDRLHKFEGAIIAVLTIPTAPRQKCQIPRRPPCHRTARCRLLPRR